MAKRPVAFITGASSGIGEGFALAYAKRGYDIALFARRTDLLEKIAATIQALGSEAKCYALDVTDRQGCLTVFNQASIDLGTADLVIASAGVALPITVEYYHAETVHQTMQVNVLGVVNTLEAVMPSMIEKKAGQIVVISSLAAFRGLPTGEIYSASKAAVNKICEGFRVQLLAHNITLTTLCPGYIRTPLTEKNAFPMPMMMSLEKGLSIMMRAIDQKKRFYVFPKPVYAMLLLSHLIPDFLMEKITRVGRSKVSRYLKKKHS